MNRWRLAAAIAVAGMAAAVAFLQLPSGDRVDEKGAQATSEEAEAPPKAAELAAGGGHGAAPGAAKESASDSGSTGEATGIASRRWRLRLTVESSVTHAPLPGATVALVLARGAARVPLGTHPADADGLVDIPLPALDAMSEEARAGTMIFVERAWAAGHRMVGMRGAIAEEALRGPPTTLVATFVLEPGRVARGRILDADGKPVAQATVLLYTHGEMAPQTAVTGEDGRYVGGLVGAGSGFVMARATGKGTAVVKSIEWSADHDVDVPDVVLRGSGVIAGTVLDGGLGPAPRVPVFLTAVARRSGGAVAQLDEPPGLEHERTMSDDVGRFRVAGLREGKFRVRAGAYTERGKGVEIATGTSDARVTIDGHLVEVRVTDPDGKEIPGASITVKPHEGVPQEDPLLGSSGDGWYVVRPRGEVDFIVQVEGCPIVVKTLPGAFVPGVERIEIPVARATARGGLELALTGNDASAVAATDVEVFSVPTSTAVLGPGGTRRTRNDPPIPLPPGDYRVEATLLSSGSDPTDTPFVPFSAPVTLAAGKVTSVEVPVVRGGRVAIQFEIPEGLRTPTLQSGVATPVGGGDSVQPEWAQETEDGGTMWGTSAEIRRGVAIRTAEAIAPGRYRFVLHVKACKPVEFVADVQADRTTNVTVRLETM